MSTLPQPAVERAVAAGRFRALDAEETLTRFLVDGMPDRNRFHQALDELMAELTGGRPVRVRAFGEMVDILWRAGRQSAALHLEELWNEASVNHSFSLLCGYVMANFYKEGVERQFDAVCRAHTHVLSPMRPAVGESAASAIPEVDWLRDRVRLLEGENGRLAKIGLECRRSFEERAHRSEERFRLLVENVEDYAICMLDPSGAMVTWNQGAEQTLGYSAGEIVGNHFSKLHPEEEVALGWCERALATARRTGRFEDEGWLVRKDGSRFWASTILSALHDHAGHFVGFGKITRDLTARVHAEAERLERMRLEEAEKRKDEALAIVGPELRNPLAAAMLIARTLRRACGGVAEAELSALDRQLNQIARIVDDLGAASAVIRDSVALSPKPLPIGDVIARAVETTMPMMEERCHDVSIDAPDGELIVHVDPQRMVQVFGNLLSNAAKYTPKGGRIRVGAVRCGEQVEASVEDTGRGIAKDKIERIFDLFTQADPERDAPSGLGIGLSVVRKLVQAHGGEVTAESDGLGRGSRFVVRLPRAG
jgi:PAS domain S-box-containing protein